MSPTVLDCASIRQLSSPAASRSIKACRENYFINFAGRKLATNEKVPSITSPPLPIYQIICKDFQITLTKKSTQNSQHLNLAMVLQEFTPFRLSHTITALPQTSDAALNILLPQPKTLLTRFLIPKCLISRFSRFKNRSQKESSHRFCNAPHFLKAIFISSLRSWPGSGWLVSARVGSEAQPVTVPLVFCRGLASIKLNRVAHVLEANNESMKKRRSSWAMLSLVLGLVAVFCLFSRTVVFLAAGIPIGLLALVTGVVGVILIYRRGTMLRGKGLAVMGICLGMAGSFLCVVALGQRVAQQAEWEHREHQDRPPFAHEDPFGRDHRREAMERRDRGRPRGEPITNFNSNLPIIVLEANQRYISREQRTPVRVKVFEAKDGRTTMDGTAAFEGLGTINARGHSTMQWPKQSYTFHTVNPEGQQIQVPLLGLPAEEDWILYSSFEDKSLMRDVLAYEIARRMGHYAPRTRFVELFLTEGGELTTRDYMGIYVLVERIKRDKERVNIAKLGPDDREEPAITGGYIVKRDHNDDSGGRFRTSQGGPYFYVYPKPSDITAEQKTWIRRYFNNFEEALYGENFAHPTKGYAAYLDVDAFIDAHWLIELSKNVDGFRYSSYITKDRGKKLKIGPAWDWNRAFGNANYYNGGSTRGWYWPMLRPNEISWHQRLREDPAYLKRAGARWTALRKDALDSKKVADLIDLIAARLEESQARNFRRWPILGEHIASNHFVGQTYQEEVDWLKKWIQKRMEWIDQQVENGDF